MKNKFLFLIFAVCVLAICLSACGDAVDSKSEVKKYLKENGLKNCTIEGDVIEVDEHKQYWNVYDKKNDIHFNVLQDKSSGGPLPSALVYDNYDSKLAEKYINDFPTHDGVDIITDDIWLECPNIQFEFDSIEELDEKAEVINECAKYLDSLKSGAEVIISPVYVSERAEKYKENNIGKLYSHIELGKRYPYSKIEDGIMLGEIKDFYFDIAYDYRFPEMEEEMSDEDIDDFWINEFNHECLVVYHSGNPDDENNEDYDIYEDICCDDSYIRFGNLYYFLTAEGFDVEGTVEDFTVQSVDGKICHFSYDFIGPDENRTYYTVDGEEVASDLNYFALHAKTVEDLFGLTIRGYTKE